MGLESSASSRYALRWQQAVVNMMMLAHVFGHLPGCGMCDIVRMSHRWLDNVLSSEAKRKMSSSVFCSRGTSEFRCDYIGSVPFFLLCICIDIMNRSHLKGTSQYHPCLMAGLAFTLSFTFYHSIQRKVSLTPCAE